MTRPAVLVVSGDQRRGERLVDRLGLDDYVVTAGVQALRPATGSSRVQTVDLLIASADSCGLDEVRRVRAGELEGLGVDRGLGVVVVGARDELGLVRAFEAGADDVVSVRSSYMELRLRLVALLRRVGGRLATGDLLTVGALRIDTRSQCVTVGEDSVRLCRREYELLAHLARDPRRVFTKRELLRDVWGYQSAGCTRTLDSHACRLRRKLSCAGLDLVINVWGVGYRLQALSAAQGS